MDIIEANTFSALSRYFFGHHPANRFEFTHGRDLMVTPEPAIGPINFLAYPFREIDGRPVKVTMIQLFQHPLLSEIDRITYFPEAGMLTVSCALYHQ